MILTWRYRDDGSEAVADWLAFLDDQATRSDLTGDQLAGWLLVRAYAEEATGPIAHPLRGKQWIERAMLIGDTLELQLDCQTWLIQGYAARGEFNRARAVLSSIEETYISAGKQYVYIDLHKQIDAAQHGAERMLAISNIQLDLRSVRAKIQDTQATIDKADKDRGAGPDIDRFRRYLAHLTKRENELKERYLGVYQP